LCCICRPHFSPWCHSVWILGDKIVDLNSKQNGMAL
jgi:hypothetical protein